MERVGERLQQARLKAGLSLIEISARTKIRHDYLEAIERDDFERLPRGLATRGFLRAFAHEVRLDKGAIIQQFRDQFEVNPLDPEPSMPIEDANSHENQRDSRGGSTWPIQFLVAGLAAALAVFMLPVRPSESDEAATTRSAATTGSGTLSSTDSHVVDASPVAARDVGAGATDDPEVPPLAVAIAPSGPVWVEASTGGSQVLYQLLYPGERRVIDVRDELLLLVGDAAAFHYSINGVVGRRLGPPGEVRRIRITRENYGEFQDH